MAVWVLALAFVITEIVAGREIRLYSYFVHFVCSIPCGKSPTPLF
jgi:hypothetical protein